MNTYCVGCGTRTVSSVYTLRIWCSKQCMDRTKRQEVPAIVREMQPCMTCGALFTPPKQGHQVHCSVRCRRDAETEMARQRRMGTPIGPRPCASCGVEFLPNRRGAVQKYCTVECRTEFLLARDRNRRGRPTPEPRDCLVCGKAFVPKADMFRGAKVVVCSGSCHTRVSVGTKRAARYTDQVERIFPMVVMERDHWTCGICGKPIDPAAPYPSSRYRSIDHIIPPAQGGTHLYANVQAAHFGCNVAKGNEIGANYMTG